MADEEKNRNENIRTSSVRRIFSLLSIILVGAIGSGVWDLFLKRAVYCAGGIFVNIMSWIYNGYIDRLFEKVGSQSIGFIILPSIAFVMFVIISPAIVYVVINTTQKMILYGENKKDGSASSADSINKKNTIANYLVNVALKSRRKFIALFVIPSLFCSIMYADLLIKETTNLSAITQMERWIDVIRPTITENEYYSLQSEFRMVENRANYQELVNKIDAIASKNAISLPSMSLYGIESKYNEK